MNIKRLPVRTVVALGAATALTLAGCGGDDDADGDTAATTTAAPAPSEQPAEQVRSEPSALTLSDQDGDGTSVIVDSVDLPSAGFVAIHGDGGGSPGPVIGVSDLLPAGTSSDVVVTFGEPLTESGTVFPMVHIDTDGNGVYEFGVVEGADGPGVTAGGEVAVGPVLIIIDGDDSSAGGESTAAPAGDNTITIADFAFSGVTEVAVGTTVIVTNADAASHTWTADDGSFDAGALNQDGSFEFTFSEPGEFTYHCNFHPSMTGKIVVTG